jgi:hypothetical protein
LELSNSPENTQKVSKIVETPPSKHSILKNAITNDQKLQKKKLNKPKSYIEKVEERNIPNPKPEVLKSRIEVIQKKNHRRQSLIDQVKKYKPEIIMSDSMLAKTQIPNPEKIKKPVIINNFLSTKLRINSKYCKEGLKSIYELTGEDSASIKSSLKNSDSSTIRLTQNHDSLKRLDDEITPIENSKIITMHRKETIDELQDFVKNIECGLNRRDIEVRVEEANRNNEDNSLDIEYYGMNKTNNSIGSITNTLKISPGKAFTPDSMSKRTFSDCKNNWDRRKSSYSDAFLELLNSEVIEDSPLSNRYEREVSGPKFEVLNQSDNGSSDVSWNIINESQQTQNKNGDNYSNDKLLIGINDFLKVNRTKRKRSFTDKESSKLIRQIDDQGQQTSIRPKDIWKLDFHKTSNSDLFDLSNSKGSRFRDRVSKISMNETSDLFKSEISTLKDFSNL